MFQQNSGFNFHSMFKPVVVASAASGMSVPGLPNSSKRLQIMLDMYSQLSLIPLIFFVLTLLYLIVFQWDSVNDFAMSANTSFIMLQPVCISLYLNFNKNIFDKFLSKLDATACMIYENPLCNHELFLATLKTFVKKSNTYTLCYWLIFMSFPLSDCILLYLKSVGLFGHDQRFSLPSQFPLVATNVFGYTILLCFYTLASVIAIAKRSAFESFIIVLFLYLNFYFKQLDIILKSIFYENVRTPDIELNLKRWIQTHHQIQSLLNELIALYTPILAMHFLVVATGLAFTAFSILQNHQCFALFEYLLIGGYAVMTLIIFYGFCVLGDDVMHQNEQLFSTLYDIDWYDRSIKIRKSLLIIGERLKKADRICIFNSEHFDLTKASFVWIIKAIASFFITMMQIQDRMTNQSQHC